MVYHDIDELCRLAIVQLNQVKVDAYQLCHIKHRKLWYDTYGILEIQ
jgi:hypothetical protein